MNLITNTYLRIFINMMTNLLIRLKKNKTKNFIHKNVKFLANLQILRRFHYLGRFCDDINRSFVVGVAHAPNF